jgi:hypothetical protein
MVLPSSLPFYFSIFEAKKIENSKWKGKDGKGTQSIIMGQYYRAILLNEKTGEKEIIRMWFDPPHYDSGAKLMEHSYLDNTFVLAVESIIGVDSKFSPCRVVWAGDYADPEQNDTSNANNNLYHLAEEYCFATKVPYLSDTPYRYLINHTKKQFVNKDKYFHNIHPLPLLTCEGNGQGGGDYRGDYEQLCGTWARDSISADNDRPDDSYTEMVCNFKEG